MGRRVTLAELRGAGVCFDGQWAFNAQFGEAVELTEDLAEAAAPWLHAIGEYFLAPRVRARLQARHAARWRRAARRRGCDPLHLPADVVAEMRLELAREVIRVLIASRGGSR